MEGKDGSELRRFWLFQNDAAVEGAEGESGFPAGMTNKRTDNGEGNYGDSGCARMTPR
jgi:hypothetical protein